MRGDHLDELVVVRAEDRAQVSRGGEVLGAAVSLGDCLVGDVPDEVLEEPVLAVFGGTWIRLHREHLFAYE